MGLLRTVFAAVSNNDTLRLDKTPSHFSPQHAGYSLPLALHQLDMIRQICCAHRNTRSIEDLFITFVLFCAAPCVFHYCGAKSTRI